MSELKFQIALPNEKRPDWERLKQVTEPGKTVLQRIPRGLVGTILVPAAVVLAAAYSVDDYKADLVMLLQQGSRNIADANVKVGSAQIAGAVRQAASLRRIRAQGVGITAIVFKKVGPNTVALAQPPSPSVSLYFTVDGTDRYHHTETLVTDSAGEISYNIEVPKTRPVWDRIVISTEAPGVASEADSRAISSTATFVW